jgi:molybdopterin/thiamine biosynthesis adenylyltransferase
MTGIAGLTADEFYDRRDHRTDLVVASPAYRAASIRITLSPHATSFADQVAFLTAVNLTARWCRRISLSAPAVALDSRLGTAFGLSGMSAVKAAAALAHAADPFARVGVDLVPEPTIHLVIGTDAPRGTYPILGRGWLAMAGDAVRGDGDTENPLGAVLAACVGVAYLFRTAVGIPRPARVRLSLWNLRGGEAAGQGPRLPQASLGRVLVVGCGAVGSAILYLIPLAGLGGVFELVDHDRVQISNLSTAPIFFADNVGDDKVEIAVEYLKRNRVAAVTHASWFDEAVAAGRILVERPDLIIPAANERNVRRQIQHQAPPLQVYGTTGKNWDAFVGRHIPLKEDCLTCRFPQAQPVGEPPLICGSGTLPTVPELETPVTATLPFLPAVAAVMTVAELIKTALPGYPLNANFGCLDFLGPLKHFIVVPHAPRRGCICEEQDGVWIQLNAATIFAQLSNSSLRDSCVRE